MEGIKYRYHSFAERDHRHDRLAASSNIGSR